MRQHHLPSANGMLTQAQRDRRHDEWLLRDYERRKAIAERQKTSRPQYVNQERGLVPSSELAR